jgi:glycosyltransferase involved in cell wall biosynthesis
MHPTKAKMTPRVSDPHVAASPAISGVRPLVSIGLPTYNGAAFLRNALDSLVAQDYPDLEILISDNGSTDDTFAIAVEFAERDPRIRVVRQEINIGAAANFNFVLRETAGPLFMWAGDDDSWEPRYVTACVDALTRNRLAVLACTRLSFMGDDIDVGYERNYATFDNPDLSSPSVRTRLRELLSRPAWYQIYGLIRREALGSDPFKTMYGLDVVLVARLAINAPFVRVNEVLFHYRVYRSRSGPRSPNDGLSERARLSRYSTMYEACVKEIRASSLSRSDKVRAWVGLAEAAFLRPTLLRNQILEEARGRARIAVSERDLGSLVLYAPIELARLARSGLHRMRGKLTRTR